MRPLHNSLWAPNEALLVGHDIETLPDFMNIAERLELMACQKILAETLEIVLGIALKG